MRFWVYSKWGRLDICAGTCPGLDNVVMCPAALRLGADTPTTFTADNDTEPNLGAGDQTSIDANTGDDFVNTGLGNDEVLGNDGNDTLVDHGGHDVLKG